VVGSCGLHVSGLVKRTFCVHKIGDIWQLVYLYAYMSIDCQYENISKAGVLL